MERWKRIGSNDANAFDFFLTRQSRMLHNFFTSEITDIAGDNGNAVPLCLQVAGQFEVTGATCFVG